VFGFSPVSGGNGVVGQANVGTNAYGVWGISSTGYAGYFSGRVNVNGLTTLNGNTTVFGLATLNGNTTVNGFMSAHSNGTFGVEGQSTSGGGSSVGVHGISTAPSGNGIIGEANNEPAPMASGERAPPASPAISTARSR
jgi:hypothetical protein